MKYVLSFELHVSGIADLGDAVDEVVEAFAELEECTPDLLDLQIGCNSEARTVHVEVTVEGHLLEDATALGLSCVRTAIHKTGGSTPDWDDAPNDAVVAYCMTEEGVQTRPLASA